VPVVLSTTCAQRFEAGNRGQWGPTCSNGAVAWCVHCNKFLTPPSVTPEGNCPRCGQPVERGLIPGMTRSADEPAPAVPWHLKLLGAALALYLGYRFLQIIDWAIHR
jgi:hypothetical protein